MKQLYIVVAIIIFFSVVVTVINYLVAQKPELFPFQKKKYFMTLSERSFFDILSGILEDQYYIFPQVYIASIIEVRKGQENYMSYFNKINRKSFDFVIFDKANLNALLAIELDDRSHGQPKRIKRDDYVNHVISVSDLEILHVLPQKEYNIIELTSMINEKLKIKQELITEPTNSSLIL